MIFARLLVANLVGLASAGAFRTSLTIKDFREQMRNAEAGRARIATRDEGPTYPEYNLSVPVDHFHNESAYEPHSDESFNLRYWFDASHYRSGGPVIVLQAGETDAAERLPFLRKGIVAQLAEATGGLGVVLEHRYYGASFPPVPDLSTESLRFLTTDQALADMAFFARHAVFPGLEHLGVNLTAPATPYLAYGGSYAGAVVALLRKLYPDVYWGAISSSGVTEAIYDYWQYFEAARLFAPPDCVAATQKLTHAVDNILVGRHGSDFPARLKAAFGLAGLPRDADFASTIGNGIAGLQDTNWDPALNSTAFGLYCANVSSTALLYPQLESRRAEVRELLAAGGYGAEVDALTNPLLNYIGYVNATAVAPCAAEETTQEACFTNYNSTFYQQDDLSQSWRAWPYQYCTQWGYLSTGSGVPADQLPLVSRLIDIEYASEVCRAAFNITTPSDVEAINRHGGFGISYPRLAIIDGEADPWRAATPHAIGQPERHSTASEPFILIDGGVHHWDENGLLANETRPGLPPAPVADTQAAEAMFVREWMAEWKQHCTDEGHC